MAFLSLETLERPGATYISLPSLIVGGCLLAIFLFFSEDLLVSIIIFGQISTFSPTFYLSLFIKF